MFCNKYIISSLFVCACGSNVSATIIGDSITTQYADTLMSSLLDEVTVVARRQESIVKADRVTYIPSAMVSGSHGSIYDAIQSIPGITIGSDGRIKAYGITELAVNIDGRKSVLKGEQLIGYLRSAPVADLERIDVVNSVSARSDGADPVTVINLVRRRRKDDGYTAGGNIDGQIWEARRIYGSVFAEYNNRGHNVSANYSTYAARNPSKLLTDRPYVDNDDRLRQTYERIRHDAMHHVSMSYQYQPAEKIVIGTSINYDHFRRDEPASMTTVVPSESEPAITLNKALFITDNVYGEVYLKRNLSVPKSNWTAACDFFNYRSHERQDMDDNAGLSVDGDMLGKTGGVVGTIDLNRSLSPNWLLSAGARISYVWMESDGLYADDASAESTVSDDDSNGLGSSFGYEENTNAVYAEGKASYGMLNASVGVRAEQNNLYTTFSGNESAACRGYSRHYFHLYPSMTFMLSTHGEGSWMISYANRIMRPRFSDLDPFIHLFDDITHVGGNIDLREAYRHALNMVWSNDRWLRVVMSVEHTKDEIVKCYRELTDKIVYVSPENVPRHLQSVLTVSGSNIRVTPWWFFSAVAGVIYSNYHFPKDTGLRPNVVFTPTVELKSVFNLPFNSMAEIRASYRGSAAYGQATVSHVWNTYAGVKKTFSNGKATVSIYVKDIFNTNYFNSTIYLSGRKASLYEKEFENMRKFGLSVSYRINGGVGHSKSKLRNAWMEEMNRVNL